MPNLIPPRFQRTESDQPAAHCSVAQVFAMLRGSNLSIFRDPDGTLKGLMGDVRDLFIPEISAAVVAEMRTMYDWTRVVDFQDGPGTLELTLPYKNIQFVDVCFIRVLPSLPWYRFLRFRNVDGTEALRSGEIDPPRTPPYTPGNPLIGGAANLVTIPPPFTGIEDADLMVDPRARTILIPPRVLISAAGLPLSNYAFMPGQRNIETHYVCGYAPTRYESRAPLAFDVNGVLIDPNPSPPANMPYSPDGTDPVDWSSGMPAGLTQAVARLVGNRVLRQGWRGTSFGLSSISVDGASESYGSKPYGGALDDEDKALMDGVIAKYGISALI